jgi:hypothetical protein
VNREGGGVRFDVAKWREKEGGLPGRCQVACTAVGAWRLAAARLRQRRLLSGGVSRDAHMGRSGSWAGVGDGCWAIVGQQAWPRPKNN